MQFSGLLLVKNDHTKNYCLKLDEEDDAIDQIVLSLDEDSECSEYEDS